MRLLRYINRDFVDTYLLIFFIILIIKLSVSGVEQNIYPIAGCSFGIIYILGAIWRTGTMGDSMNNFITDDTYRSLVGLRPFAKRNDPIDLGYFRYVWLLIAITMTVFGLFII